MTKWLGLKPTRSLRAPPVADLLTAAWKVMVERYPKMCDAMLKAVPQEYRLSDTGFTKVTVSINNPVRHTSPVSNESTPMRHTHISDAPMPPMPGARKSDKLTLQPAHESHSHRARLTPADGRHHYTTTTITSYSPSSSPLMSTAISRRGPGPMCCIVQTGG